MASFQFLIGDVFQLMQTVTSLVMLPSQVNFRASKFAWPISAAPAMPRANVPMTVPSFGATENT